MNPLKRLRVRLAKRKELRERARSKARRHQKAVLKLRLTIRAIKRKPRSTTRRGARFIATFEGFCSKPVDIGDGVTTVGIGHVIHSGPPTGHDRTAKWVRGQKRGGVLTYREAITLFLADLEETYEPPVRDLFRQGGPLHGRFAPWRFDALVSVAYNLGTGAVQPGPHPGFETLGKAIGSGNLHAIARALPLYRNPGSIFEQGLLRRRKCEGRLLLTGQYKTEL